MRPKSIVFRVADFAGKASQKFNDDHLSAYAAQATFYLLLAIFPFTMLVCIGTRFLPFLTEDTLLALVMLLIPEDYQSIGTELVDSYYNENVSSTSLVLIVFLIWTCSRLMQAMMNGFNTAYGIHDTRNQTLLRLIGCIYTVLLCAALVSMIGVYALGSRLFAGILGHLPNWALIEMIISLTRDLAAPAVLLLLFWLSYVILPGRKGHFRMELPGAILTMVVWRGSMAVYGYFLQRSFERYSYVYGSLASLVFLLVWIYTDVFVWFVGAELNWYLSTIRKPKKKPENLELLPKERRWVWLRVRNWRHNRAVKKELAKQGLPEPDEKKKPVSENEDGLKT